MIFNRWKNLNEAKKSAIVFTISVLIVKGLSIFTTPVFTRIMTTEDIGIVSLFTSWSSIIAVIASLALTSGGYFIGLKDYSGKRNQYTSSILTLTTLSSLLLILLYYLFPSYWINIIGLSNNLILLMLVGFMLNPAYEMWLSRYRYENKYKFPGAITVLSGVLATSLSIVTVIILKNKGNQNLAEGRLFATSIVTYIINFIIFISIFRKGQTGYNKIYWLSSLKLSIPLIGHAFALQVLSVSDRMMIDKMVGTAEVGIYSVLYSIGMLSMILWTALNSSYVPYLFQNIDNEIGRKDIKKTTTTLILIFSGITFLITLFAPEIINFFATDEYLEAVNIIPPIVAGIYLTSIANLYSNILVYEKETAIIMISTIGAAVINIVLNYLLIPIGGYQIAAYTTLIAYMGYAFFQALGANHIYKKRTKKTFIYSNIQLFLVSLCTVLVCMVCRIGYSLIISRYIIAIIIGVIIIVLYNKSSNNKGNVK